MQINYISNFILIARSILYGNISLVTGSMGYSFPNIALPTILFVDIVYYLIFVKDKKNKAYSIFVILLSFSIFLVPYLDFAFNAFHNIRGLTHRYSFIFILLAIKLFIYIQNKIKYRDNKKYSLILIILLLICIVTSMGNDLKIIFFTFSFILSYFVLWLLYDNNIIHKNIFGVLFVLQIIVANIILIPSGLPDEVEKNIVFNKENVKYRINNIKYSILNDDRESRNYYFNNKTTYYYTSMSYNKVIMLNNYLGVYTSFNTFSELYDDNELLSLLLNVKNRNNNYYLEKIYSVNKKIINTKFDSRNIKNNVENLINNVCNINDIYNNETINGKLKKDNYHFNSNYDYFLVENKVNNSVSSILQSYYKNFHINKKYTDGTVIIYTLNKNKLKDVYDCLSKNQIEYTYYNDNHIKGIINVDENQLIFTSIPYDKDWEVKVDGKKVKAIELLDSLMGIEAKPGKHEIELEYKTHYLIPAVISITTFILLVINAIIKKRKELKNEKI